ncbi:MAG: glycosyl hydrolase family 28-related protein [Elainellaceae cyanobacterium]
MTPGSSGETVSRGSQSSIEIVFPEDAGLIDVTSYGAIPSDAQDDTEAIQQALNEHPTGNHIFYFPNGIYDISSTLTLAGSQKRNIFQGQSEVGTVLRLMDSVDDAFDGALINFGPSPAQRFRNGLRNMTISIGLGHSNAIGVQFNASNQGIMKHVTILSEDGSGQIGLDMEYTDEIGPLLIKDVTVDGFDHGIWTRWPTASQTFEDITLINQNTYGWFNLNSQRVFARNVQSINEVTAIRNDGEAGFVLIDSSLTGTGTAASVPAIINQKSLFVRNTETAGYASAIDSRITYGRGNPDHPIGYVNEYLGNGSDDSRSGGPFELFPSPDQMLGLPVQDSPELSWETDLRPWDGPHRHVIGSSGLPDDGIDDTPSIQAAIASGATTIYLPRGTWQLEGTIELGENVERFLGAEAAIAPGEGGKIRVTDGSAPIVAIERLEIKGKMIIEHASGRTLLLNDLLGSQYVPAVSSPGDVFINDSLLGASLFRNQNVWARQLNIEGDTQSDPLIEAKVLNDGAQVWILGLKTEDEGTVIKTINGGSTELYGTLHVGSGTSNETDPRFVTVDASFSAAGVYGGDFRLWASETRNGETRTADTFNFADAYTAYRRPSS